VLLIIAGYISHNRKALIKTQESKASSHLTFVLCDSEDSNCNETNSIPVGDYILNEEKTYCEGSGKVSDYDSSKGTIKYTVKGNDECKLYFKEEIQFEFAVSGYDLTWNALSGASQYNVYSNGELLTSTSGTTVEDLYLYFETAGTYSIEVRPVKSTGSEVKCKEAKSYSVAAYQNGYVLGEPLDYTQSASNRSFGGSLSASVPSNVTEVFFINIPELYASGEYPGGTWSLMAVGGVKTDYLTNIPHDFCLTYPDFCIRQTISDLRIETNCWYLESENVLGMLGEVVLIYDSSTSALKFETLSYPYTTVTFFALKFIVPGTVSSSWEKGSYVCRN